MSEEQQQIPPKTEEQIQEEIKQKLEEERAKQQQRKKLEEEARIKAEQDLKKLEQVLKGAVSVLGKSASNRSLCYNRLSIAQKQIERLFPVILKYKQIRYLDLSSNTISDLSLIEGLPNLIWVNASKNQVSNLQMFSAVDRLQNVQNLNLSTNKIKQLTNIGLPSLKRLNLSENQITEVNWKGHNVIEILQLRKNKLRKLKNISNMKNLKQLYVCQNQITDIRGIENCPQLYRLSVRNNKINNILSPFPYLPSLTYLNLRENQIAKIDILRKIDAHVNGINFLQNPLAQELGENAKKQVIYILPHFIKINKSQVTIEDRVAFQKQLLEKLAEKQRERLAQQEEARKAAEEGKAE